MEISYILELVKTPLGISMACLIISSGLIKTLNIENKMKVFTPGLIGIVLSGIMLLLGKFANFGAYAGYEFNTGKDGLGFGIVAVSPGCISNSIYDTKLLEWLLKILGISKDSDR